MAGELNPYDPGITLDYFHSIIDDLYLAECAFREEDAATLSIHMHAAMDNLNSITFLLSIQLEKVRKYKMEEIHCAMEYLDEWNKGDDRDEEKIKELSEKIKDTDIINAVMKIKEGA